MMVEASYLHVTHVRTILPRAPSSSLRVMPHVLSKGHRNDRARHGEKLSINHIAVLNTPSCPYRANVPPGKPCICLCASPEIQGICMGQLKSARVELHGRYSPTSNPTSKWIPWVSRLQPVLW